MLAPTPEGTLVYPNNQGATNWYSPSFSPRTGLFYIPTWADTYSVYRKTPGKDSVPFTEGQFFAGTFPTMAMPPMVAGGDQHAVAAGGLRHRFRRSIRRPVSAAGNSG